MLSRAGEFIDMLVTSSFVYEVFDESGRLDTVSGGISQWVLSIDTQGTLDIRDDEATFAYPGRSHGAFKVGDFCENAVRFTTG